MFEMKIAGLYVQVKNRYPYVERLCKDWIVDEASKAPDMTIEISEEEICEEQGTATSGAFSKGYCEGICVYRQIAKRLHMYDAFVFHASVLQVDGEGYAFAAKSGVGKSTHTRYWLETYRERASVVNGDKPIIRYIDDRFYAFGTPWQGKEGWGENTAVPLKACAFLSRGKENQIRKVDSAQIVMRLFHQVLMPKEEQDLAAFMVLIERFVEQVPFYLLECNLDKDAAEVAYAGMGNKRNEQMKIKKGFILKKLSDQNLVVAVGQAGKDFHGMIRLNETGSFLWAQLEKERSEADLIAALMKTYGIDQDTAKNGVEKFLTLLKDVDCIER